ncbi:hypothetical protein LCGC14_0461130 [marine sediment metagenome]|uniref:Uncharacterized protein n=1 Tax=marine sediment metagenome TaxID=412755 RepID=A0A0F9V1Y3_9ZZZZ|nr:hypothetical protein [bacterium]
MSLYNAQELRRYGGKKILIFSGTITASGNNRANTSYPIINVKQFKECTFFLRCSALVGTPGTFVVLVETKHPAGAFYETLATFATLTGTGQSKQDVAANLGENISLAWTLTTFTSATFTVYGIFKIM